MTQPEATPQSLTRLLRRNGGSSAAFLIDCHERQVASAVETFLGLTEIVRTHHVEDVKAAGFVPAVDLLLEHPASLADIAQGPLFLWWTGILAELLGAASSTKQADMQGWIRGRTIREATRSHLDQIAMFAGAVATRAGVSFALETPVETFAYLPSSATEYLDPDGKVPVCHLLNVREGEPVWDRDLVATQVPTAVIGGLRMTIHAHHPAYLATHIERWERVCARGSREAFAGKLSSALTLVDAAFPGLEAMAPIITHCVLMDTHGATAMASGAYTRLQGAVFLADTTVPILLAEMFVHEYSHTRLSLVEREFPLFADSKREARHYSPWRDDLRPAEGVLHALFVHSEILRLWLHHLDRGTLGAISEDVALRRVGTLLLQLRVGVDDLRLSSKPSPLGAALLDDVEQEVMLANASVSVPVDVLPFFSEIKSDVRLHRHPITRAIAMHRSAVRGDSQ